MQIFCDIAIFCFVRCPPAMFFKSLSDIPRLAETVAPPARNPWNPKFFVFNPKAASFWSRFSHTRV